MGRNKKYITVESKVLANREKAKRHYYKNKATICATRMKRYYSSKANTTTKVITN